MVKHYQLLIITLVFYYTCCSICPPSASPLTSISIQKNSFVGTTLTIRFSSVAGHVDNTIYFMIILDTFPRTAIRKLNISGDIMWMTVVSIKAIQKSLAIDANEQNVYFASKINPMDILKLQTSTGAIIESKRFANIMGNEFDMKIFVLQDNSAYFIFGKDINSNRGSICKYLFSVPSSVQCQLISTIINYPFRPLMISSSKFFLLGSDPSTPYPLHLYQITFGSISANWTNKLMCPSGICVASDSESLTSIDLSILYSFFIYGGSSKYLYFISFSVSDGSVIGTRYKSNTFGWYINGSVLKEDLIVVDFVDTSAKYYVMIFNSVTLAFKIKQFKTQDIFFLFD